jgi:N-acetyl-gamma-glutamyl-phosphate reductase
MLIEKWEATLLDLPFEAPYALGGRHKHIPEMMRYAGLAAEPYFVPAVGPFRCGMRVELPLPTGLLQPGVQPSDIRDALRVRYGGEPFVKVRFLADARQLDESSLDPRACNDTNRIELIAIPHASGHVLLVAILDNLGKGAAGVAVQNLNLMLGLEETSGIRP